MSASQKPLVVITGGSSGIGVATARLFSSHGHPLLLLARRLDKMQIYRTRSHDRSTSPTETRSSLPCAKPKSVSVRRTPSSTTPV